jgi:hypothetical protein
MGRDETTETEARAWHHRETGWRYWGSSLGAAGPGGSAGRNASRST